MSTISVQPGLINEHLRTDETDILFSSSVMTFSVIEEENKWFLKAL